MGDKYINKQIGIYVVLKDSKMKDKDYHKLYEAKCNVCGQIVLRRISDMKRRGNNCVHLQDKSQWNDKRLKTIYNSMKARCYNPNDKNYKWYGLKGIKLCDEWLNNKHKFYEWSINNGYKNKLTIDRINSNEDYCPENCRWVSNENNARYKSSTITIIVNGIEKSGRE